MVLASTRKCCYRLAQTHFDTKQGQFLCKLSFYIAICLSLWTFKMLQQSKSIVPKQDRNLESDHVVISQ